MNHKSLPDDPDVLYMLKWIMKRYNMKVSDLARMFQTTPSTIHYWLTTGRMSYKNLKKLRSSFYFLNNSKDPHAGERKCRRCGKWLPLSEFRNGKAICKACENKRTLEYYHNNRNN